MYIWKKSRKYKVLTEPLRSTIPRQHWLCKYLQPPHFWPGLCISPVLGHFEENTSTQIQSNCRCMHTCVLWPNICYKARFPASKICPASSPTRSCTGSCACNGELHLREMIRESRQWSRLPLCSLKKENSCKLAWAYHRRSIFLPLTAFVLKKNNFLHTSKANKHTSESPWVLGWVFFLFLLLAALQFSQSMKIKIVFFIKKRRQLQIWQSFSS